MKTVPVILMLGGGLAACALAVYAYLTPYSGVTDAPGPLLAAFGGVAVALAALILAATRGGVRILIALLSVLGLLGTAAAGHFLLQPTIIAAVAVAAVGFLWLMAVRPGAAR